MTPLFEEMIAAGRGMVALLLSRRDASDHFDLTLRGLAGSFIAFMLAAGAQAIMLMPLVREVVAVEPELAVLSEISTWHLLMMVLVAAGLQFAFAALALRVFSRSDGFLPFLVAANWANFYLIFASLVLSLPGLMIGFLQLVIIVAFFALQVNIARLIVTLPMNQAIGFLLAQYVGPMLVILTLSMMAVPA